MNREITEMTFEYGRFAAEGVLATSQLGRKVFAALINEVTSPSGPTVLYLDFKGVQIATTSFLREAVVAFRNHARQHIPHLYPVAANLSPEIKEELAAFLRDCGDAMPVSDFLGTGTAEVIGQLDGKQLATLRAALNTSETDASALAERFAGAENIGTTAWNNRLAALAAKGLLIETSAGRAKRYRPVLENLTCGP
jgi:hypothetical protein